MYYAEQTLSMSKLGIPEVSFPSSPLPIPFQAKIACWTLCTRGKTKGCTGHLAQNANLLFFAIKDVASENRSTLTLTCKLMGFAGRRAHYLCTARELDGQLR